MWPSGRYGEPITSARCVERLGHWSTGAVRIEREREERHTDTKEAGGSAGRLYLRDPAAFKVRGSACLHCLRHTPPLTTPHTWHVQGVYLYSNSVFGYRCVRRARTATSYEIRFSNGCGSRYEAFGPSVGRSSANEGDESRGAPSLSTSRDARGGST